MILYCDKCKWDEMTGSKHIPDGAKELEYCPVCGDGLYVADSYEDIP